MIKANFMTLMELDLPDVGAPDLEYDMPALGGRLRAKRIDATIAEFEFSNFQTTPLPDTAPFRAHFIVTADFTSENNRAVFNGQPKTDILEQFDLIVGGGNNLTLSQVEMIVFQNGGKSHFRPALTNSSITNSIADYFSPNRVVTERFDWDVKGSGGDADEYFRLTFPKLLGQAEHTLWEWQRYKRSALLNGPDEELRKPSFGETQSEARLIDFVNEDDDEGAQRQDLQIRRFACNPHAQDAQRAMAVCFKPRIPDRTLNFDPAVRDRNLDASQKNSLTYGFTAANGELVVTGNQESLGDGNSEFEVHWERALDNPEEAPPVFLVNSVSDEHGMPVAFRAAGDVRLSARPDRKLEETHFKDHLTLGGLDFHGEPVVGGIVETDNRRKKRKPIDGEVRPLKLDAAVRSEKETTRTHWLREGEQLVLEDRLPEEVDGGARNAFFAPMSGARANAKIEIEDVEYEDPDGTEPAKGPLPLKRLQFDEAVPEWSLNQVYEEFEYGKDRLPTLNGGAKVVGMRKSNPNGAGSTGFSVPAMDVKTAAANMAKEDGGKLRKSVNTEAAAVSWFKDIDEGLISRFKEIEEGNLQAHRQGFGLKGQPPVPYASVVGRMRKQIDDLDGATSQPVLAETADSTFQFGKNAHNRDSAAEDRTDLKLEEAARVVMHRVWLLQYIVEGTEPPEGDFAGVSVEWGTYADWKSATEAIKRITALSPALNPAEIRKELLLQLEGLTAPTRHFRQLTVVLGKIIDDGLIELFADLKTEIDNKRIKLAALANLKGFKEEVTKNSANQKLVELTKRVQAVINGWEAKFDPSRYEIKDIGTVIPVYHRLVLSVLRFVQQEQHEVGAVKEALKKLPAALEEGGDELFEVFERAWLYKMAAAKDAADPKGFFEALGNNSEKTGKELMDALKGALLTTLAPSQEFVVRLGQRMAAIQEGLKSTGGQVYEDYVKVTGYFAKLQAALDKTRIPEFDAVVEQGRDDALKLLQAKWDDVTSNVLDDVREYIEDEIYSDEVYQKILDLEDLIYQVENDLEFAKKRARELRDKIADVIELGKNAGDLLQSLKTEPPQYLVVGQSFHVKYSKSQEEMIAKLLKMWGRTFDLCSLGGKDAWDFKLVEKSTLIMKLSGEITITQVLNEIQTNFREDSGEPDPLGLWTEEMRVFGIEPPHKAKKMGIDKWSRKLVAAWVAEFVDPELHIASWRGAFIVNPMADLERNTITRQLCGLRYIDIRYLAMSGGAMNFNIGDGKTRDALDVYATIFKKAAKQERETNVPASEQDKDSGIALTKFEARIKNTQLRANSSIELTLGIDRLFGRDSTQLDSDEDKNKYNNLIIRGETKEPDNSGDNNEGLALEFSAIFPDPLVLPVGVMFIESVKLRSIKAALYNGRTALDIDGDVELTPFKVPDLDFEIDALKDQKLLLSGFRLNFPEVDQVADAAMGALRDLIFDFESLKIMFETPRSMTLGFMELSIRGLGYMRLLPGIDDLKQDIKDFWNQFSPLGGSKTPDIEDLKNDLIYMLFDIDFGQLPKFGIGSVDRLRLTMFAGAQIDDNNNLKPYFGITGLDAKDIEIDLFRLLKLSIAKFYMTGNVKSTLPGYTNKEYSVIGAEDMRLQMLGIDLIGQAKGSGSDGSRGLDYLMLQDREGGRGVLGVVNMEGSALDPPFLTLHWLLLARNMEVDPKILEHLLLFGDTVDRGVVHKIVSRKKSTNAGAPDVIDHVKAGITGKNDWLFGISFKFAEFIENCRLILQDEVFYGITLQGDFLEPIFGDDRMTLAYIPGDTPSQDRFLLDIPLEFLNLFSQVKAGWGTFSWALNTDTLIGLGFPFRVGNRYLWDRSFQIYITPFMGQFGFYVEKRTRTLPKSDDKRVTIGGGLAVTFGYGFALGNSMLWVRGGIGVFAIIEGSITSQVNLTEIKFAVVGMRIRGVIGVIAFVEGGIDIWIVSARFRVELQAALGVEIFFERDVAPLTVAYDATLYAGYHASATIKLGFCKITHTVSGNYAIGVSGQHLIE